MLANPINNLLEFSKWQMIEQVEKDFAVYIDNHNKSFNIYPGIEDIRFLFSLYDKYFFDLKLLKSYDIDFGISLKLTRSAGITRFQKYTSKIEIKFSYPLIFNKFNQSQDGFMVNGVFCQNPQQALMRVMEHEIVHLLEFLTDGKSSCSKPRFIQLAYQLFGHTENKHKIGIEIPLEKEIIKFKKGERVKFFYKNKTYIGKINRITKRATVIVEENQKLSKYYVPVCMLEKC